MATMTSGSSQSFESQTYCLRRNDSQSSLFLDSVRAMFEEEALFDCTLVCDGKPIKAHKLILAAASQYFKAALTSFANPCQNTAVIIKDVPYLDLKAIIDFIYRGELFIEEKQIQSLQKSVQALKVTCICTQTLQNQSKILTHNLNTPQNVQRATSSSLSACSAQQTLHHQQQQQLNRQQSFQTPQVYYPGVYQPGVGSHVVKIVSSQTTQQPRIIYQPHEPFVQLKELLRRETPHAVGVIRQGSESRTHATRVSDREEASTTDEEFEVDIPSKARLQLSTTENKRRILKVSDSDGKSEPEGCMSDCQEEQVIDMSVNSNNLTSPKADELRQNNGYIIRVEKSSEADLDLENKDCDTSVTITSEVHPKSSNVPLSVTIPSISSATARAIAASTKLAVASGLLTSSSSKSEESGHSQGTHTSDSDFPSSQSAPLKRGRGRPPRHLQDSDETKTYKVRPILPSNSSSQVTPGIIISSEPSTCKRSRFQADPHPYKSRRFKSGSPLTEGAGKNVCPYCPQVYYSTQAMNDHINNVHTRNSHKYICEMCSKEFSWKISLVKHLRKSHEKQPSLHQDVDSEEPQQVRADEAEKPLVIS